jgi:hypothetical protein
MSQVTAAKLAGIEGRLSNHDRLVIDVLDRVRLATTEQLHRLLTLAEPITLRRTQAKLAKLRSLRVIDRLDRNVGGVRAGSTGHVYALDTAGQRLASGCGPAGGRRLRRPWTPGLLFINHQLAVTELFVRLREAESDKLTICDFDAEPLAWRTFIGPGGARVVLKPDAFLNLAVGDRGEFQDTYFIEVDQATQSLPAIKRKLAVYRRFYATGRDQERYGAFPQVLFLAPNEQRRGALADLIAHQPEEIRRFVAVALSAAVPGVFIEEDA